MPTSKVPVKSHVRAVVSCERSSSPSPSSATNETSAPPNATKTESVEIQPAVRRPIVSPSTVIANAPASGANRQIHAPWVIRAPRSTPECPEAVDVEDELAPRHGDDDPEADDDLRGRDCHHGEREDLAVVVAVLARERDQREVRGVEHDLEREQHDQRAAPQQHAERPDREEDRRDDEVPGRVGTHQAASSSASSSRVRVPRMTPPTAATSSTIDVISN